MKILIDIFLLRTNKIEIKQNTKQCLNKKECTHIRKMQSTKQATKQMGCERKENITLCFNF
jgi:hypothetical protein